MRFSWFILFVSAISMVSATAIAEDSATGTAEEETKTITFNPNTDILTESVEDNRVRLGVGLQMSHQTSWTVYFFHRGAFLRAFGGEMPDKEFEVEVVVMNRKNTRDQPEATHYKVQIISDPTYEQTADTEDTADRKMLKYRSRPDQLRDDVENDRVTLVVDGGMMGGSEDRYHFDRDEFLRVVGGEIPEEGFKIEVRILSSDRVHHQVEIINDGSDGQTADSERTPSGSSTFGDTTLAPGFFSDPEMLKGKAGGSSTASSCEGYFADSESPDHVVMLSSDFRWLEFAVRGRHDQVSLMIVRVENDQQNLISCTDLERRDATTWGNQHYTPLQTTTWEAGEYWIYVGAEKPDDHPEYELTITEIRPEQR